MLEFIRKAYSEFMDALRGIDQKVDILTQEVRVRNAQNDVIIAQLRYLIELERENQRKQEDKEARERMSIVMPMAEETM